MNADQLRAIQAPLKQGYRDNPASAVVTSRAEGRLVDGEVACIVPSIAGDVRAGLHPAAGGGTAEACSADMLLQALVACAGVTARAVATASGISLTGRIIAEGQWDARGTLGIDKETPIGLTDVTMTFDLQSDAPADKLARVIASVERYCVILQTLRHPPRIEVRTA